MIRVFNGLSAQKLFAAQKTQFSETKVMTGVCPPNAGIRVRTDISNLGHFLCLKITGSFSTLRIDPLAPPAIIDDGIDHLRGQLIDGAGQRKLYNDFIPLSLLLSPGRRRDGLGTNAWAPTATAAIANPGGDLFYPGEFEYLFSANSQILMDVRNDSDATNRFDIAFHGITILSGVSVAGVKGV